jgi:nucleoside-diphosphate-sugar epimerase
MVAVDADILITGVTGFVGRFVLLNVLETQSADVQIAVVIRPTGSSSAEERFRKEIIGTSMFASWRERLQKVHVIESTIESLILSGTVSRIIHCAGSFTGGYDALERDNVRNVRRIMDVAGAVDCKSFTLLSTCFVHPRTVRVGTSERVSAAYEDFYNDYTYTKWRGEELAFEMAASVPCINVLRLALVSAPVRPELQVHPHVIPALMQHGVYVKSMTVKPKSRLSIVPVDVAAAEIVRRTLMNEGRGILLAQICPPPTAMNFHLSLPLLAEVVHTDYGMKVMKGDQNSINRLPWYYHVFFRKIANAYEKLRSALTLFSAENVQFESSCPDLFDERLDERGLVRDLCKYVERMYYEYQLQNHYQLLTNDLFIHRLTVDNPVVAYLTLNDAIRIEDWPTYKRKLWTAMCTHRKFMGVFDGDEMHTTELEFDAFFGEPVSGEDSAERLEECVRSEPMKFAWKFKPIVNGGKVKHLIFMYDHGLTDGAGMLHIMQSLNKHVLGCGEISVQIPKREPAMSWWREIIAGVSFLCMLVYTLILSDTSSVPSLPQVATGVRPIEKRAGMTFTGDVLWRLTHMLKRATGQDKHVIGVVAAGGYGTGILQNNCISIPLPVDASMTEAEFARRAGWVRSRAVIGISIALQWLVEFFHLEGFLKWVLKRVKILISTMMMPALPGSALYVCPNIPQMVSLGVTAVTKDGVTNFTVRSHSALLTAEDTISALL